MPATPGAAPHKPPLLAVRQVHVLNGEKYKEVCPDNTLLNTMQLRACIIAPNQKKPLLKRDGGVGVTEDNRIFLMPENGQAPLSELQCTTSSEALLCGKAPTFRLLVWATDMHGNHLQVSSEGLRVVLILWCSDKHCALGRCTIFCACKRCKR